MAAVTDEYPPAVTDLAVADGAVSWWRDATCGGRLESVSGAGHRRVAEPPTDSSLWTVIGCQPGPDGWYAVVVGRPGADYGYLCCVRDVSVLPEVDARALPLVRRPSVVWSPEGRSLVYPRFGIGIAADQVPPDGVEVAVHRLGTKFRSDEILLPRQAAHTLVVVEPMAEPDRCLLRVADGRLSDYYVLDYGAGEHAGPRVTPLVAGASARTQLVLAEHRWWIATGLGTERSTLLALPPGSLDRTEAEEIVLRVRGERVHPAYLRGSRDRLAVRAISPAGEHVLTVDRATLRQDVVAGDIPGSTVSELAGSVSGTAVAWTELTPAEAGRRLRVRLLADGVPADAALTCVEHDWPLDPPTSVRWYAAGDGTRLPMYVSRGERSTSHTPVLVLAHGGTTGLLNAPFERALQERCASGDLVLVRAVTRTLRQAGESDHGRRAYDDLLAAARTAHRSVASGRKVALVGFSMGAVSAARAVLADPDVLGCAVLRFPVADLVSFPDLGIGRHWVRMLGDPNDPADEAALRELSPCHQRSTGRPVPPVLIQVGRFDSRAHPQHGIRLRDRLAAEPGARPELAEFDMGHLDRLGCRETARAVTAAIRFVLDHMRDQPGGPP